MQYIRAAREVAAALVLLVAALVIPTGPARADLSLADLEATVAAAPPVARPRSATARPVELIAVDCVGLSLAENNALLCLQGLVNRRGPRLFLVGLNEFNRPADLFWLERFRTRYGLPSRPLGPWQALAECAPQLSGTLVYSPAEPWTEDVADMIGALTGWLPVTPEVAPRAEAAGLQCRGSLAGLWPDRRAAQRWALDHLLPKLGGTDFGTLPDGAWLMIRDYLVMRGAFMTDLSSLPGPERELKSELMSRLPPGSIQWGWTADEDESTYTRLASSHGHRTLCSTNAANMSVFSQLKPLGLPLRQPPRRSLKPERKVYLAFVLSDGDSIPIIINRQWQLWTSPARGKVPFGWEIQPLLTTIAPVLLEFYYEDASPLDEFIVGPSGAGYANPTLMPNLDQFMRDTQASLPATDTRVVGIIDDRNEAVERRWTRACPSAAGFLYGWGGNPAAEVMMRGGKPHCDYRLLPPAEGTRDDRYYGALARTVRDIARREGLPCCVPVHLSCYWSGPEDMPKIAAAVAALGLPVEVIKPSEMMDLMRQVYSDRLRLSGPPAVQLMPGLSATVGLTLTSTSVQALSAQLTAQSPPGVTLTLPAPVRVAAESTAALTLTLTQTASTVANGRNRSGVVITAGAGDRTARLRLPIASVAAPSGLPANARALQSVWEAEALSHDVGREETDPAALNGRAWSASGEGNKWAVWGPYETLSPGRYAVGFRLRTQAPAADAPAARLDVFDYQASTTGGQGALAAQTVRGTTDGYADLWLTFDTTMPRRLEYRVGAEPGSQVTVDRIVVVRLGD